MVRTSIEIDDDLWRIVKIKSDREDMTVRQSLHEILQKYIEDYGEEYGYSMEKVKKKD